MKNSQNGFAPLVLLLIAAGVLILSGAGYWFYQSQAPQLIGGQKDAHGCLGPAGYSWCEVKQKCLRVWEEKCEATSTAQTANSQTIDWKIYKNTEYGFQLTLNDAWKGYRVVKTQRTDSFGGRDETYITLDFEIPTQDQKCFIPSSKPEDKNWMSPDTTLEIWTKDAWNQMEADTQGLGGPGPVEFARNDSYVFAYDSYGPELGNMGCALGFEKDYLTKYSYGVLKTIQFLN